MKPRLRLDPTRPGRGKWECLTDEVSSWGNRFTRIGKGYTRIDAYHKWKRCGRHQVSVSQPTHITGCSSTI